MTVPKDLILLGNVHRAITEARTVDEVRQLRDKASAVQAYAKKVKLGQHILVEAATIKIQAERKLGQMISEFPLRRSAPGNQYSSLVAATTDSPRAITLSELGITKSESSRSQQLASLPDSVVERYLAESLDSDREPTTAALLRLAKRTRARRTAAATCDPSGGVVTSLAVLIAEGRRFSTIYADPPWGYANQGTRAATSNHYPTMTVDEICCQPVAELAADRAHLHLWTTNSFLPCAFEVLEAWGFSYKSCFIWVKPQMGIGNYWRVSHEFLLLGVRGNMTFSDHGQRSWLEHDRTGHSRKPDQMRSLIERVSPAPYLEMYAREKPTNNRWTVYGNQIEMGR